MPTKKECDVYAVIILSKNRDDEFEDWLKINARGGFPVYLAEKAINAINFVTRPWLVVDLNLFRFSLSLNEIETLPCHYVHCLDLLDPVTGEISMYQWEITCINAMGTSLRHQEAAAVARQALTLPHDMRPLVCEEAA